jgi:hypothetical protein
VTTLVAKNEKKSRWRLWWDMEESAFGGSLESGGRFCVSAFDRNLVSVAVKMFSHLIYFIKKFYKFCNFNAFCKDNAAINCITIQHKEIFIPVNFDGSHTTLVFKETIRDSTQCGYSIRNNRFVIVG